ncbi:monocarboxylate transporter 12-like [Ptychodera flava]|uniref:monocarboxylate transporter 12-like n=1 Tax=Ptychodera flava TaxID=63121 RepID=UPI003969F760
MTTQRQADYYWKWLIVCCAFYTQFYTLGAEVSRGVFIVEFLEYFGEGASLFTWIFMFSGLAGTVAGPVAGYAISKYGARKVVLFSAILHTLAIGTSVFAESVPHLIVTFGMLNGIGLNIAFLGGYTMIPQYFTDRYAFANGLAGTGGGCGSMVLPPIVVILIEQYGWHGAMIVLTGFSANLFVCAAGMKPPFIATSTKDEDGHAKENGDERLPDDKRGGDKLSDDGFSSSIESVPDDQVGKDGTPDVDSEVEPKIGCPLNKNSPVIKIFGWFVLREYPLFAMFALGSVFYGVYVTSNPLWIVVRAVDLGIPRINAATLMTYIGGCGMISRLMHGWFIDRGFVSPFTLLILVMAIASIANIVLTFTTSYAIMVVSCVFIGLSQGICLPIMVVSSKQLVRPVDLPSALGLFFSTVDFSSMWIPVQGKILDATEDSRLPLLFTDVCLIACTIVCVVVCKVHQKRIERDSSLHISNEEQTL